MVKIIMIGKSATKIPNFRNKAQRLSKQYYIRNIYKNNGVEYIQANGNWKVCIFGNRIYEYDIV